AGVRAWHFGAAGGPRARDRAWVRYGAIGARPCLVCRLRRASAEATDEDRGCGRELWRPRLDGDRQLFELRKVGRQLDPQLAVRSGADPFIDRHATLDQPDL